MKNILFILSSILLFSCQKVIDIKPETGEEKVIIQGYLFTDSIARVKVTKSTAYLSATPPPVVKTAVVTLSDNHGNVETLVWNSAGKYYESQSIKGVVNDIYTLEIYLDGIAYTSKSVLPYLNRADTIIVDKEVVFDEESYSMELYATIPTNEDLFFLFKGYADNQYLNKANDLYVADNKLLSGSLDGYDIGYEDYEVGQEAKLELFSLTEPAYKFYISAALQLNNDGGFFSTPPANVPSMFSNGAVGVFQCSDKQILKTTVLEQQ